MAAGTAVIDSGHRLVLADLLPGDWAKDAALVVGGAGLVGLTAQLSVPIPGTPVPVTGQSFAVLLVGAALGSRRGLLSMLLYVVLGLGGLPWFAGGASGMVHATFGYLIGFVLAGALVGALAERGGDRSVIGTIGSMVVGNLVIYAAGSAWLVAAVDLTTMQAWEQGIQPFLIGAVIKTGLAAGLLPGAWALANRSWDDRG